MEIQQTSFELSKQLKETGYKQESEWVWAFNKYGTLFVILGRDLHPEDGWDIICHAPTVAELSDILCNKFSIELFKTFIGWGVCILDEPHDSHGYCYANTIANTLAEMWLYLKKKGLI